MTVSRRQFLVGAAAGFLPAACSGDDESVSGRGTLFPLGVASGDPLSDGIVLWTRIARNPFGVDLALGTIAVSWEIARDAEFHAIERCGVVQAAPDSSHCVHVDVADLEPNTRYYYRFEALGEQSPTGRTHTLPRVAEHVDQYSVAVVSCQDISMGYFTAYRDIVAQDPDLIIHLGDYIYETAGGDIRPYPVEEAMTLDDYRALYTQYRLDSDLRRAHAEIPWVLIWDDHEVVNDWGPSHYLPSSHNRKITHEQYLVRKEAAIRAFKEYLPVRWKRDEANTEERLYERTMIGDLMELNRLDVRSYRDTPACELNSRRHFEPCEDSRGPERTLLGQAQERWLLEGLGTTGARWNSLVQATVMAPLDLGPGPERLYEADSWDNYEGTRNRIIDEIKLRGIENVVSLGGNIHAFYAGLVYDDQWCLNRRPVMTEIVATSVTAAGGGDERFDDINGRRDQNPGIRYFENRSRGYALLNVKHDALDVTFRTVDDVAIPNSTVTTLHAFQIVAGSAEIVQDAPSSESPPIVAGAMTLWR